MSFAMPRIYQGGQNARMLCTVAADNAILMQWDRLLSGIQPLSVTASLSLTALLWTLVPPLDNVSPARLSIN